jgi:hypothetical protein
MAQVAKAIRYALCAMRISEPLESLNLDDPQKITRTRVFLKAPDARRAKTEE